MTTHELARLLLKEPDVPLMVEGWTDDESERICIASPFGDEEGESLRFLVAEPDFEPERTQPDSSTVGQSEL